MANKMVMAVMALLMAFYVSESSAWVYSEEEAAVIAELEDSVLEDIDWEELFEDSSEVGARSANDILKKLDDQCKCEGLACHCCGKPKIAGISFEACVNMTMFPTEKIIEIGAGFGGNNMYKNISVAKLERVCDRLPGFLKKVKLCMYNTWTEATDDQSMTSCTSIDVQYSTTTIASVKFHCLELKDGKVSFTIPPESGRSAVMSFKMKNPVKALAAIIKNKIKSQ